MILWQGLAGYAAYMPEHLGAWKRHEGTDSESTAAEEHAGSDSHRAADRHLLLGQRVVWRRVPANAALWPG